MKQHYEFIDFLRVIAILGVILQHSCGSNLIPLWGNYMGGECSLLECYRSLSKYNILLFIFISGYLLIPKMIPITVAKTLESPRISASSVITRLMPKPRIKVPITPISISLLFTKTVSRGYDSTVFGGLQRIPGKIFSRPGRYSHKDPALPAPVPPPGHRDPSDAAVPR